MVSTDASSSVVGGVLAIREACNLAKAKARWQPMVIFESDSKEAIL